MRSKCEKCGLCQNHCECLCEECDREGAEIIEEDLLPEIDDQEPNIDIED